MGELRSQRECPRCAEKGKDRSRDNLSIYQEGDGSHNGYCYGCGTYFFEDQLAELMPELIAGDRDHRLLPSPGLMEEKVEGTSPSSTNASGSPASPDFVGETLGLDSRRILRSTCERYGYLTGHLYGEKVEGAPFCDEFGRVKAYKVRKPGKHFEWMGTKRDALPLFGQHLWTADHFARRVLVITEGEIDCLTVSQVLGPRKPVVSVPDGATSAARAIKDAYEFVSAFDKVVLLFDQDRAGKDGAAKVAETVPFKVGQLCSGKLPLKDPNEVLLKYKGNASEAISNAVFRAVPVCGEGVLTTRELKQLFLREMSPGLNYPWDCLNEKLYGMRQNEMVVWGAGTGVGKSTILWSIACGLIREYQQTVGIFTVEGDKKNMIKNLVGMGVGERLGLHHVWSNFTEDQLEAFFDRVVPENSIYWYHSGVAKDLFSKIRYVSVAHGVKWFLLDHITSVTAGMDVSQMDKLLTELRDLVEELNIGIHVVCHLRKADGTPFEEGARISLDDFRGSGNTKQLADIVMGVERKKGESNVSRLRVLKNRYEGGEGLAGALAWDRDTGLVKEVGGPAPAQTCNGPDIPDDLA